MCFFCALLLVPGDWSNYRCSRLNWMVIPQVINIFVVFLPHSVAKQDLLMNINLIYSQQSLHISVHLSVMPLDLTELWQKHVSESSSICPICLSELSETTLLPCSIFIIYTDQPKFEGGGYIICLLIHVSHAICQTPLISFWQTWGKDGSHSCTQPLKLHRLAGRMTIITQIKVSYVLFFSVRLSSCCMGRGWGVLTCWKAMYVAQWRWHTSTLQNAWRASHSLNEWTHYELRGYTGDLGRYDLFLPPECSCSLSTGGTRRKERSRRTCCSSIHRICNFPDLLCINSLKNRQRLKRAVFTAHWI